ncbi:MAG: protein of unknown function with transrane region [Candidatus Taylorbacteria bacterium]|nr:protein of unknown function with transrane region [Candidatus Taylorbacteria bacterium]
MTPEERNLLERTLKVSEENNDILKSIRRSNRISTVLRVLYWIVIIGLSFGAYYFIQPYIEQVSGLYNEAQQSIDNVKGVTSKFSGFMK